MTPLAATALDRPPCPEACGPVAEMDIEEAK